MRVKRRVIAHFALSAHFYGFCVSAHRMERKEGDAARDASDWGAEYEIDYDLPARFGRPDARHQHGLLRDFDGDTAAAVARLDASKRRFVRMVRGKAHEKAVAAIRAGLIPQPSEWTLRDVLVVCGLCEMDEDEEAIRRCASVLFGAHESFDGVETFRLRGGEDPVMRRALGGATFNWPEDEGGVLARCSDDAMSAFAPLGGESEYPSGPVRIKPNTPVLPVELTGVERMFGNPRDRVLAFEAFISASRLVYYSVRMAKEEDEEDLRNWAARVVRVVLRTMKEGGELDVEEDLDLGDFSAIGTPSAKDAFAEAAVELVETRKCYRRFAMHGLCYTADVYARVSGARERFREEFKYHYDGEERLQSLLWEEYAFTEAYMCEGPEANAERVMLRSHVRELMTAMKIHRFI